MTCLYVDLCTTAFNVRQCALPHPIEFAITQHHVIVHTLSSLRWIFREYPTIYSRRNVLIKPGHEVTDNVGKRSDNLICKIYLYFCWMKLTEFDTTGTFKMLA